jgi:hypothetical protein
MHTVQALLPGSAKVEGIIPPVSNLSSTFRRVARVSNLSSTFRRVLRPVPTQDYTTETGADKLPCLSEIRTHDHSVRAAKTRVLGRAATVTNRCKNKKKSPVLCRRKTFFLPKEISWVERDWELGAEEKIGSTRK